MTLGPLLRRELITSVRRAAAFQDRLGGAVLAAAVVAGCVVAWDWWGWDRASVAGAAAFARATFGLIVAAQAVLTMGLVPGEVAPRIASERDRKSLDALLTTPLSGAQVVLGTTAAGLVKPAAGLAALLPVAVVMVFLGGVDPRLVLLAGAGLVSTALALAALSVAVSVGARTARRALSYAISLAMAWMGLPLLPIILLPRLWPAGARWTAPVALWLLDSSPTGVAANLVGLVRRGSLVGTVLRMIALQAAAAAVLLAWASWRLRPAARALCDGEGRALLLRLRRTRRRPRPACGDDPVLWNEIHSTGGVSEAERLVSRLVNLAWIGLLTLATSWFARPAFAELAARGYGAAPQGQAMPELNPFARVLLTKLTRFSIGPAPGQARLEFNIVLRQVSAVLALMYAILVAGAAAEGVAGERERDTWLGLIATPLTGREILGAKMLGAVWRARVVIGVMIGLWTVGLLAGALHPLGFLAELVGLAASGGFFAALGTYAALWSHHRERAVERTLLPTLVLLISGMAPLLLPPGGASILMGSGSMPLLAWSSLLSYEDVRAALLSGAFPPLAATGIRTGEGAGRVLAAWLIGTTAQAAGALVLARAAFGGFDAAVGRPMRPRGFARRP
jgi:ABC-type transport system involved in multi-copper enzyme maturation permease subunit